MEEFYTVVKARCSKINSCCSGYTLDKKRWEKAMFSRCSKIPSRYRSETRGLTVLRAETLTLAEKKKPLLRRGRLGLILEREKQKKYPFP